MADSALFVGFGFPVRGREQKAMAVFSEAVEYYTRRQQGGDIESFEPVLLEAHGGELGGFFLLRGDREKLAHLRSSDEFGQLTVRAQLIADHVGVVAGLIGEGLASQLSTFAQQVDELA